MHRAFGFQRSSFEDSYRITERIGPWLSDRQFFAQTLPRLAELGGPFMAFLLTSSNHHPYRLPVHEPTERFPSLEGTELGRYITSVNYFDRAFGEFVEGLRRHGLLDTSVIVVYGDHHGFLADDAALAALLGYSPADRFAVLRTRKTLPLLIRLPKGALAGPRHAAGGHIDIAPTILSLLGVETKTVFLGNDLTQGADSLVVFRDGSFTDGAHYYFRRSTVGRGDICYEAATARQVSCTALEEQRRKAEQRLAISDVVIRGNLVPRLAPAEPL
jgi:phosphoglycerol transferase MdoB-like AlkP superfamily enzyme